VTQLTNKIEDEPPKFSTNFLIIKKWKKKNLDGKKINNRREDQNWDDEESNHSEDERVYDVDNLEGDVVIPVRAVDKAKQKKPEKKKPNKKQPEKKPANNKNIFEKTQSKEEKEKEEKLSERGLVNDLFDDEEKVKIDTFVPKTKQDFKTFAEIIVFYFLIFREKKFLFMTMIQIIFNF
jgi:hypothetical protein